MTPTQEQVEFGRELIRYFVGDGASYDEVDDVIAKLVKRDAQVTSGKDFKISLSMVVIEAAERIIDKHPTEWGDSPLADAIRSFRSEK